MLADPGTVVSFGRLCGGGDLGIGGHGTGQSSGYLAEKMAAHGPWYRVRDRGPGRRRLPWTDASLLGPELGLWGEPAMAVTVVKRNETKRNFW